MSIRRAEKKAQSILNEYEIYQPPVDLEYIARELEIDIQYEPFQGELSGVLIRNEDKKEYIIGVNETHPLNRQRFTIAHEIGHFLLHEGNETFIDKSIKTNLRNETSSMGYDAEEVEANAFAAALLMPEDFIYDYLDNLGGCLDYNDDEEIKEMARLFQVSPQALMIRLGKLGVFD